MLPNFSRMLFLYTFEFSARILSAIRPVTYFSSRRILRININKSTNNDNRILIFATSAQTSLHESYFTFFETAKQYGYRVVAVVNGSELDFNIRARLEESCYILIERLDIGRDFGAYKDSIDYLFNTEETKRLDRIIICNDSVFYRPERLDQLFHSLEMRTSGVCGLAENGGEEDSYHLSSFFLHFSSDVIVHSAFRQFWLRYNVINTRKYTIDHGEKSLSALLAKSGFKLFCLFKVSDLSLQMDKISNNDLIQACFLLPPSGQDWINSALSGAETLEKFQLLARQRIADFVAGGNQTHRGALLFQEYLDAPFIKKDLVFRCAFPLYSIEKYIISRNIPYANDFIDFYRNRGRIRDFNNGLLRKYRILLLEAGLL